MADLASIRQSLQAARDSGDEQAMQRALAQYRQTQQAEPQADSGQVTDILYRRLNDLARRNYSALDTATLGYGPRALNHLVGFMTGQNPQAVADRIDSYFDAAAAEDPTGQKIASLSGDLAGVLAGGVAGKALEPVLQASKYLRFLVPATDSGVVKNAGKAALTGSAIGGAAGYGQGGTATDTAIGAVAGGVLGPLGAGLGAGSVRGAQAVKSALVHKLSRYGPEELDALSPGTWRKVAKVLGVDEDQAKQYILASRNAKGLTSAADVLDDSRRKAIPAIAETNPEMANELSEYVARHEKNLGSQVARQVSRATPKSARPYSVRGVSAGAQTPRKLVSAVKRTGDKEFGALRDKTVTVSPESVYNEEVHKAIGQVKDNSIRKSLMQKYTDAAPEGSGAAPELSGKEVDVLRQQLTKLGYSDGKPVDAYLDAQGTLLSDVADNSPAFRQAVAHYADGMQYTRGFEYGKSGGLHENIGAGHPLSKVVDQPSVGQGIRAGERSRLKNEASKGGSNARGVISDILGASEKSKGSRKSLGAKSKTIQSKLTDLIDKDIKRLQLKPGGVDTLGKDYKDIATDLGIGGLELAGGSRVIGAHRGLRAVRNLIGKTQLSKPAQKALVTGLTSTKPEIRRATLQGLHDAVMGNSATRAAALAGSVAGGASAGNLLYPPDQGR